MTAQCEETKAWQILLPILNTKIQTLRDNREYELSHSEGKNLKTIFKLINQSNIPKTNQHRFNAQKYFLMVVTQSKELFILSALAGGKAPLRTFGGAEQNPFDLARCALSWFRNLVVPRRLVLMTELYFFERSIPEHIFSQPLFKNAQTTTLFSLNNQTKSNDLGNSQLDRNLWPTPDPELPREDEGSTSTKWIHSDINDGEYNEEEYSERHPERGISSDGSLLADRAKQSNKRRRVSPSFMPEQSRSSFDSSSEVRDIDPVTNQQKPVGSQQSPRSSSLDLLSTVQQLTLAGNLALSQTSPTADVSTKVKTGEVFLVDINHTREALSHINNVEVWLTNPEGKYNLGDKERRSFLTLWIPEALGQDLGRRSRKMD